MEWGCETVVVHGPDHIVALDGDAHYEACMDAAALVSMMLSLPTDRNGKLDEHYLQRHSAVVHPFLVNALGECAPAQKLSAFSVLVEPRLLQIDGDIVQQTCINLLLTNSFWFGTPARIQMVHHAMNRHGSYTQTIARRVLSPRWGLSVLAQLSDGSRLIQTTMALLKNTDLQFVCDILSKDAIELCQHKHGNFVFRKLIEEAYARYLWELEPFRSLYHLLQQNLPLLRDHKWGWKVAECVIPLPSCIGPPPGLPHPSTEARTQEAVEQSTESLSTPKLYVTVPDAPSLLGQYDVSDEKDASGPSPIAAVGG